jgi:hypothetical protein
MRKMTMKLALARIVLSLMLLPTAVLADSQTNTNAFADGYFLAPDGSLALVDIVRTQDPTTNLITTELFYTFCGQAGLGASCQQGDGLIPNSSVSGGVYTNVNKPDVFTVQVDTSTIAGYRNKICSQGIDYDGDCLGEVPATGGLISISWTRTNAWANVETSSGKSYQLGKLVFSGSSLLETFSANQTGTVLGVPATSGAVMVTSTDSQRLKEKFAALKVRTK